MSNSNSMVMEEVENGFEKITSSLQWNLHVL